MAGKWIRQAEIAARTVRTNELLHATDVNVQRTEKACLGTAVNLQLDAVRLVLVGQDSIATAYFEAIRDLTAAAISSRETWVFTDAFFARCEALRHRAIASWALARHDWKSEFATALESWRKLVEAEVSLDTAKRNAHVIYALMAAHCGETKRAAETVASLIECDEPEPWCSVLSALKTLGSRTPDEALRWGGLVSRYVVSASVDQLVGDAFDVTEACMLAKIRADVAGSQLTPYAVIRQLRGEPTR